jgi:fermentation-respiration switch protein FrsA (DUF1100 family)
VPDSTIEKDGKIAGQAFAIIKQEPDTLIAARKLRKLMDDVTVSLSDSEKQALQMTPELIDTKISQALSPWLRFFLTYDPRPTLQKIKCPVLAIGGEKDLQVPSKENLAAIGDALKSGGNTDYTVREFPGLNHLLQHCKTGSPLEYSNIEETISPDALQLIGDWIIARTAK